LLKMLAPPPGLEVELAEPERNSALLSGAVDLGLHRGQGLPFDWPWF